MDEATRAVMLELGLHSFSARKLLYVRVMLELPAEGGSPLAQTAYITFNTFNSFDALHGIITGEHRSKYWSDLGANRGGVMDDR